MYTATVTLKGENLSYSRAIQSTKKSKETHDAFEKRTWRERMHVDKDGFVFIPALALKHVLEEASKGKKIPGQGMATYTKPVMSGVITPKNMKLNIKAKDVEGETLFVPSDGKKGGAKRVSKTFPVVHDWETVAVMQVYHDAITPEVLEMLLKEGGAFVGFLRWRPQNGGNYGRFEVSDFSVVED